MLIDINELLAVMQAWPGVGKGLLDAVCVFLAWLAPLLFFPTALAFFLPLGEHPIPCMSEAHAWMSRPYCLGLHPAWSRQAWRGILGFSFACPPLHHHHALCAA